MYVSSVYRAGGHTQVTVVAVSLSITETTFHPGGRTSSLRFLFLYCINHELIRWLMSKIDAYYSKEIRANDIQPQREAWICRKETRCWVNQAPEWRLWASWSQGLFSSPGVGPIADIQWILGELTNAGMNEWCQMLFRIHTANELDPMSRQSFWIL